MKRDFRLATNKEIKAHVKATYGFVPDDCWIAHARAARRSNDDTAAIGIDIGTHAKPCSDQKRVALFAALRDLDPI